MARVKGTNAFLIARYIVFGLFMICNAIICSIAVWNYGLVHPIRPLPVDIYLIFVGALALLSIFTLVFVELLCSNPVTTRVWFECAWITFFWTLELAGGAALVAIGSNISCSGEDISIRTICTSGRLLLAFTWICVTTLFAYLLALVFIAASRYNNDPHIWSSDIRVLRVTIASQWSPSPLGSPLSTRFKKRADVNVYTPQPIRARPPQLLQHHSLGFAADYEIEPFRPVFASPEHMDVSLPHLPEAIPLPPSATAAFVPSFMNLSTPPLPDPSQFDRPRELMSSITYANSAIPSESVTRQSSTLPSPSPLGNWPRPDIMKQPAKPKRKSPPPSAFEFPNRHVAAVPPSDRTATGTSDGGVVTPHRPRRPSGPRSRVPSVESVHRPAPLDLSGISNYLARRQDDAGLNA